jgi:putative transposase
VKISKGFKVELKPNNRQITLFKQHAGTARFVYNWALSERKKLYETEKKSTNAIEQHRLLNQLKKKEFSWMYDLSKCTPQQALRNVDKAFQNFFRDLKSGKKAGFPQFKSKHKTKDSFYLEGSIHVQGDRIKLPRIGWVRLKEKGRFPLVVKNVIISEQAGKWFISANVEMEIPDDQVTSGEVIGIDFGIKTFVHTSNNEKFENPRPLKKKMKKLKRVQKELSRRKKGSNNRKKSQKKLAKVHYKISCIRKDSIHKMTSQIVKTKPSVIVVEDLAVKNMVKNHKLAQALSDSSISEGMRQLNYKSKWSGILISKVDRYFPSSKLCNKCGSLNKNLTLSDREWICENCGSANDRDYNAALNIRDSYLNRFSTDSSSGINAHGQNVRLKREVLETTQCSLVEVRKQQEVS